MQHTQCLNSSSPYKSDDWLGIAVELGIERKITPYNTTDTEAEEMAADTKEEFVRDDPIIMRVRKTLVISLCSPSD